MRFGHYVTYTFDGNRVVKFDDSCVRVMDEHNFQNEVRGISTPYVALYVREDISVDVRMSRDETRYVFQDHGKYLEEIGNNKSKKEDSQIVPVTSALGKIHHRHHKEEDDDDNNDNMNIPREPRFGNFGGGSRFVC